VVHGSTSSSPIIASLRGPTASAIGPKVPMSSVPACLGRGGAPEARRHRQVSAMRIFVAGSYVSRIPSL
jgi:hypothetical protein